MAHVIAVVGAICDGEAGNGVPLLCFAGCVYGHVHGTDGLTISAGILANFTCTAEGPTTSIRKYGAISPAAVEKVSKICNGLSFKFAPVPSRR